MKDEGRREEGCEVVLEEMSFQFTVEDGGFEELVDGMVKIHPPRSLNTTQTHGKGPHGALLMQVTSFLHISHPYCIQEKCMAMADGLHVHPKIFIIIINLSIAEGLNMHR